MSYKIIDLCAGIGGIRRGFERAGGFTNVLSAEIDKYACITYQHLFGDNPYNDITTECFKQLVAKTRYDVLLAGFPCQSFSRAGKKFGFLDDTRGTLFFDIASIIKQTRPKAFMLENVDNLITHDKGNTFATIIHSLVSELGYHVIGVEKDSQGQLHYSPRSFLRNSKHFGVPQNRPRVYIVGFDAQYFKGRTNELPHVLPEQGTHVLYKNIHQLLEQNVNPKYYLSSGYVQTLKKHRARHEGKGNGFGYIVINTGKNTNPIANAILATGGSGKERNLIFDPQEHIAGMQLKSKKTPLNAEGLRVMTPNEWGKLQGFINYAFIDAAGTDTFTFPKEISNAQQYKQFGNAVTIPVIEHMATFIHKCLSKMQRSAI